MTPVRREVLQVLEELSNRYPDMRIGQLVANFACLARGPQVESIYDVEDEEFLASARRHLDKQKQQQAESGSSVGH
jgi:hypothetical protein